MVRKRLVQIVNKEKKVRKPSYCERKRESISKKNESELWTTKGLNKKPKLGKRRKVKTSCLLPADIVEIVNANFAGTDFDNLVSLIRKVMTKEWYDPVKGIVLASKYYEQALRSSYRNGVFTKAVHLGIFIETKSPIQNVSAAYYKVGTEDLMKLTKVNYKEVVRHRCKEDKAPSILHIGRTLNELEVNLDNDKMQELITAKVNGRIDLQTGTYTDDEGNEFEATQEFIHLKKEVIFLAHKNNIDKLRSKNHLNLFHPKRNETNRRLDHSFSVSDKIYTEYFTHKDEKLIEFDLSNSQPIILTALIDSRFSSKFINRLSDKGEVMNYYYKDFAELLKSNNTINPISSKSVLEPSLDGLVRFMGLGSQDYLNFLPSLEASLRQPLTSTTITSPPYSSYVYNGEMPVNTSFEALTKQSKLYEFICDVKGWDINKSDDKSRAKKYIFGAIYGAIEPAGVDSLEQRAFMETHFPEVMKFINDSKKIFIPFYERFQDEDGSNYKKLANKFIRGKLEKRTPEKMASVAFAVLLQRIEAYIFIDKILPDLAKRNIPCLTKHDSILVPESYAERTKKIMTKYLDIYLGSGNYKIKKS